jgi:hypothetical protein
VLSYLLHTFLNVFPRSSKFPSTEYMGMIQYTNLHKYTDIQKAKETLAIAQIMTTNYRGITVADLPYISAVQKYMRFCSTTV